MRFNSAFYLFLIALTLLDAVLLRSPNLLGEIGLIIYKYHYLRTFPRALLTVSVVIMVSIVIGESICSAVKRFRLKRTTGRLFLFLFMLVAVALLVRIGMDFSSGVYSHTGIRFRIGACLLPATMLFVFGYYWITLPKVTSLLPKSPPS